MRSTATTGGTGQGKGGDCGGGARRRARTRSSGRSTTAGGGPGLSSTPSTGGGHGRVGSCGGGVGRTAKGRTSGSRTTAPMSGNCFQFLIYIYFLQVFYIKFFLELNLYLISSGYKHTVRHAKRKWRKVHKKSSKKRSSSFALSETIPQADASWIVEHLIPVDSLPDTT